MGLVLIIFLIFYQEEFVIVLVRYKRVLVFDDCRLSIIMRVMMSLCFLDLARITSLGSIVVEYTKHNHRESSHTHPQGKNESVDVLVLIIGSSDVVLQGLIC
jgi:hypothetical protein